MEIKTNGFKLPSGDIHVFIPPEPTETDRGGIKASEKTTESLEVKYDKKTGKLFSPTSPTDNTLTESNVAADAKKTGDEFARVNNNMESKLDKQQGVENKGKALVVGEDGNVVVGEVQSSGNADIIKALQDALISQVVNGESINVSDSSRLPVEEFAMSGKLEQVQTTGAQLFDVSKISATDVTVDKDIIIVKEYASNTRITAEQFLEMTGLKPGDSLTISYAFEGTITDSTGGAMFLGGSKAINIMNGGQTGSLKNTVTLPSDFGSEYGSLYFFGNKKGENCYIKNFMINKGNTAKPYEPYTGGKPAPSPDNPQPIETTPQGVITVDFTDGTNHQVIELNCPREFTKWDRLEKIDGVWNWAFKSRRYIITGNEEFIVAGAEYTTGSSTNLFTNALSNVEREPNGYMERLRSVKGVWHKVNEVGFSLNSVQLHMRLPNTLLGVSDTATKEEKKTAYVSYLKEEYEKGKPYSLLYELKEPELIPLSLSEQNKLNAITMYAPHTEITNTGGCNMELTYTVDTKAYVDAKIAPVVKTILETQKALL